MNSEVDVDNTEILGQEVISLNGCWVRVYRDVGFGGELVTLYGPGESKDITGWKWPSGDELGDSISSLRTGPNAWFIGYEDEDFEDKTIHVGPNATVARMGDMDNQIDSFQLFNQRPPNWPG